MDHLCKDLDDRGYIFISDSVFFIACGLSLNLGKIGAEIRLMRVYYLDYSMHTYRRSGSVCIHAMCVRIQHA